MPDDESSIFGNLPGLRDDDQAARERRARTRLYMRLRGQEEGPLPPSPWRRGVGGPSIGQGAPAVTGSTWSTADAAANSPAMTLSGGNLIVTPSGATINQSIRGTISHSTGKWYVEFFDSAVTTGNNIFFGFADSSFAPANDYLGHNGASVGIAMAGASYGTAGFTALHPGATVVSQNDVYQYAIDFDAGKAWLGINNTWFNGGPSGLPGTPMITIAAPALGVALFPGMTFNAIGGSCGVWTLRPTAASQRYLPPPGFQAWDGGPMTPVPFAVIASVSLSSTGTTAAINTTGADLIVINLASGGMQAVTITDTYNNTWLTAIEGNNGSNPYGDVLFYCQGPKVGSNHTFTITTARVYGSINVGAFAGSLPNPLDQTVASVYATGTAGPITPTTSNQLIVTGAGANNTITTAPAGFSLLANQALTANFSVAMAYQTQITPTAVSAAWTAPALLQTTIASFKLAQAPPSTWSTADASANSFPLSNGNLTVTRTDNTGGWSSIRSAVSKSSGKFYVEILVNTAPSASVGCMIGLASNGFGISNYLGSTNYSFGLQTSNSMLGTLTGFVNKTVATLPVAAINDVWALAVDFAGNIWVAQNNVWLFSGNPATGSLPNITFTPATVGPLFVAMSFYNNPPAGTFTLQPTAASQKYAPPAGFSPWG